MHYNTICVIANGENINEKYLLKILADIDFIIAVDGGTNICQKYNIKPNVIIGDLDSAENFNAGEIVKQTDQRLSDMEKALDFALQFTPTRIIITAAFGKRKDHSFINLLIFQKYSGKVSLEIIDDFGKMRILQSGKHTLHGFPKKTISLFSLGEIRSLTLSGFKYNLQSRDFKSYFYGLSNVYLSEKVCIEFSSGTLFVYEVWSGKEGKKYLP